MKENKRDGKIEENKMSEEGNIERTTKGGRDGGREKKKRKKGREKRREESKKGGREREGQGGEKVEGKEKE